jgi:hypothetical protein
MTIIKEANHSIAYERLWASSAQDPRNQGRVMMPGPRVVNESCRLAKENEPSGLYE